MTALRQADVAGALALVADAGALDLLADFPGHVLPRLQALLCADFASFTAVSPDGPPTWLWSPEDAMSPERGIGVAAHAPEHPVIGHMARTGDLRARTVSDFIGLRDFQRLEIYELFFRDLGARFQLAASFVLDGPVPSGMGFTRTRSDFTQRERTLLDLLRPHLGQAYRQVAVRTEASRRIIALERGLEAGGQAVARARNGRLEPLSPRAGHLLRRWFGSSEPELPAPGRPLVLDRGDARLLVRTADGDPPVVVLDERRYAPDASRVAALGLTAREAEIVALVARGLGDADIARELFLSVRTVGKHLEHVYRKLGVAGRRDAVARVLAD